MSARPYEIPQPDDLVRVTPLGYAGWIIGRVERITKQGAVEVDCDTHGCFRFEPSDCTIVRKAGE